MTAEELPLLSICIPTYNRSSLLEECLNSVVGALRGFETVVEVLVSDNASGDNTLEVVGRFQLEHPFIRYNRNDVNVVDDNFFIAASLARGKYIWLFADDDLMESGAIAVVLQYIAKSHDLIICNYSVWDKTLSRKVNAKFYRVNGDIEFTDHNELLKDLGTKLQFISSIVVRREHFLALSRQEYEGFHKYGVSFLLSLYCGIMHRTKAVLIAEPLLRYRGDNSPIVDARTWYKFFSTGTELLFEELEKREYSARALHGARGIVLKDYIMHDLSRRKRNGESLEGLLSMTFSYYKHHYLFWILVLPIFLLPEACVALANGIVVRLRSRKKSKSDESKLFSI